MGRPINKRNFGKGTGNQIKTKFKLAGTEQEGYILSQRSSNAFRVSNMADDVTGICRLVDKNPGELDNGDMVIVVKLDNGTVGRATKIANRVATVNGVKVPWNFSAATDDGAGQIADADAASLTPVITIDTQPQNTTVVEPATATFSVVASAAPTATLTYQWQLQEDGSGPWVDIEGATDDEFTTGATTVADDNGDRYRVIVNAAGAKAVTSAAATLTVTAE